MSGRKWWTIALAIWMLLWGLLQISNVVFAQQGFVMGILAIGVAVLVAFDK